jgi:hypothetical protein
MIGSTRLPAIVTSIRVDRRRRWGSPTAELWVIALDNYRPLTVVAEGGKPVTASGERHGGSDHTVVRSRTRPGVGVFVGHERLAGAP